MSFVEVKRDGHIATVMLNRPERMNAISTQMTSDLHDALFEVNNDPDVRVVIFHGEGRAFCAGDDLKEFDLQTASDQATVKHIDGIQQITRDLMFSDKPYIGAVHGYAVGGGFEWMLNCDLIVAADDLIAFNPEFDWGQFPTGGVTHLMPQAIGYQKAMQVMVLGERLSAKHLDDLGLVNWVTSKEEMLTKAREVAETVASKSPYSVSALKRLMTRGISGDLSRALDLEGEITIAAFKTEEAKARSQNFPTKK